MSDENKLHNKVEELGGKAKEALGDATDDRDLQAAGSEGPDEGQPQAGRREDQGRLQVGRRPLHCGCCTCIAGPATPAMREQHPQCAVQRRCRRARTAGSRGRSAAIQSRSSSSSARTQRSCACSCATGAPPEMRAHHTRRVDTPGAPPPTTPSSTHLAEERLGHDRGPQLLPDLADQRRQVRLPRLHLAAGELPAAVVGATRPLGHQHPVAVDDRRADHLDDVQRPSGGRRRVGVEVALHRPQDPPAQHHLVDEAAQHTRQAGLPVDLLVDLGAGAGRGEPPRVGQPPPALTRSDGVDVADRADGDDLLQRDAPRGGPACAPRRKRRSAAPPPQW